MVGLLTAKKVMYSLKLFSMTYVALIYKEQIV